MTTKKVLRVPIDSNRMKKLYSRFSFFYGLIERFETNLQKKGLNVLNPNKGEIILEIGFGRGTPLLEIARSVGPDGKVYGIDLTPRMVQITQARVNKKHLSKRVRLTIGDAKKLPYEDEKFDKVYIASTLELFDTKDIPLVLKEVRRVLKNKGKLCVVSIPREGREHTLPLKLYEWFYKTFPNMSSCRPIYLEISIVHAGYNILKIDNSFNTKVFPMKIVLAEPNK